MRESINLSVHAWYVASTYAAARAGRASSAACLGEVRASRQARQLIEPTPPPHEWCEGKQMCRSMIHRLENLSKVVLRTTRPSIVRAGFLYTFTTA
jgi:hypothetical protein